MYILYEKDSLKNNNEFSIFLWNIFGSYIGYFVIRDEEWFLVWKSLKRKNKIFK